MNCLTKLFQQKRRRIGYIQAFSGPMISKRDSSDINYSSAQFIYISSFLLKRIVLPILFLGGITKRIYQNNMVDIPHSYKIDCPRSKDAQASGCCSQAHGKNLLTIPVCTAFHCMTVSTSRYHQHLA